MQDSKAKTLLPVPESEELAQLVERENGERMMVRSHLLEEARIKQEELDRYNA